MKIELPNSLAENKRRTCAELNLLLSQPGAHLVPPCQHCCKHVALSCNAKCVDAPRALSSDPDNYPVEPKVVPLVYELRKTRVMQPCWSCEGHFDNAGNLWKYPQVSFYSVTSVYAMLLVNHLTLLKHKKLLNYDWQVAVSSFGQQCSSTTYTIEPKLHPTSDQHLGAMQADLLCIAENLDDQLKIAAKQMLQMLKQI